MLTGVAGALVFSRLFSGITFLYYFPVLFGLSILGCLIGTYTAPPTDEATLKKFYSTVRPWGFWKPVHEKVVSDNPAFQPNKRFGLDMFNVVLGIIAQLCLTVLPMYIVLGIQLPLLVTLVLITIIVLILKKTWWDKLNEDKSDDLPDNEPRGTKIKEHEYTI
jgi:hypothetical protein